MNKEDIYEMEKELKLLNNECNRLSELAYQRDKQLDKYEEVLDKIKN